MFIANAIFFLIIGTLEAYLWHYSVNKISRTTSARLHYPLVAIRAAWFIHLLLESEYDYGSIIPLIMCYPFFHLGAMYQVRHWLNKEIYTFGFFSNASKSSTSLWDKYLPMDGFTRTLLFLIGSIFYFLWNL